MSAELPVVTPPVSSTKPVLSALLSLVAAAGLLSFLHAKHPVFTVPVEYQLPVMGPSNEQMLKYRSESERVERQNGPVYFGIGGCFLGIAMACGAARCCSLFIRVGAGALWGGLWGAATGYLGARSFQYIQPITVEPTVASAVQAAVVLFALLGLGMGLLVGGFQRSAKSLFAGLVTGALAGALGGAVYPILAAFVLSGESVEHFVPVKIAVRILWLAVPFAAIGWLTPYMVGKESKPNLPS